MLAQERAFRFAVPCLAWLSPDIFAPHAAAGPRAAGRRLAVERKEGISPAVAAVSPAASAIVLIAERRAKTPAQCASLCGVQLAVPAVMLLRKVGACHPLLVLVHFT